MQASRAIWGRHQRDRDQAAARIGKLDAVFWVKAHLEDNETARRAAARKYPVEWHELSKVVGALAKKGMIDHIDDAGLQILHSWDADELHCVSTGSTCCRRYTVSCDGKDNGGGNRVLPSGNGRRPEEAAEKQKGQVIHKMDAPRAEANDKRNLVSGGNRV